MKATILLFASARETVGAPSLTVELDENSTVGGLRSALARACPALIPLLPFLRIAIDSEYARNDQQIIPHDAELAVIPPVSGGSSLEIPAPP